MRNVSTCAFVAFPTTGVNLIVVRPAGTVAGGRRPERDVLPGTAGPDGQRGRRGRGGLRRGGGRRARGGGRSVGVVVGAAAPGEQGRAGEYDDWWLDTGRFAERERAGWAEEVERLVALVGALPAARTLDVACGTAFLGRHLQGLAVGLDQSAASVAIATARLPGGIALTGDALALPFADHAFDRVFTGHFYGHLPPPERARFLAEAARVAPELLVVDTARRDGVPAERTEPRILDDGSEHQVFKRFLTPEQLVEELPGEVEVLLAGRWFLAARATPSP